jgi:hypothetical protein
VARRAAPAGLAAGLHAAALAALILLAPAPSRDAGELAPAAIEVRLVTPPVPEPALETIQDAQAQPPDAAVPEPPAPELAEPSPPEPSPSEPAPSRSAAGAVVLDAPGGVDGLVAMPTRGSALRGLACARAFDDPGGTLGCPEGAGLDFSRYASGEAVAQVGAVTQARFDALYGLYGAVLDPSLRRLPGQQGMEVMQTRRAGLSGADEMRESLPPMVPDPAFGD